MDLQSSCWGFLSLQISASLYQPVVKKMVAWLVNLLSHGKTRLFWDGSSNRSLSRAWRQWLPTTPPPLFLCAVAL